MGGEKSQYAMEINAFYGMSFVCIHMEGYFVMYQILRKKMNSDLSDSGILVAEKAGVSVVVSASKLESEMLTSRRLLVSQRCRAVVARNAVVLKEQCQNIVWKEHFSDQEQSAVTVSQTPVLQVTAVCCGRLFGCSH